MKATPIVSNPDPRPVRVIIPARGRSTRIPKKNLQEIVPGKSLLQWCIELYHRYLPEATIVVATEDHETSKLALSLGCELHGRVLEDITDERSGWGVVQDMVDCYPNDQILCVQCTSPFTFRSEVLGALAQPKPYVHSAYIGQMMLQSCVGTRTQNTAEQMLLLGNFYIVRQQFTDIKIWADRQYAYPMSWLSAIDIDEPNDLDHVRQIATVVTQDFLYNN